MGDVRFLDPLKVFKDAFLFQGVRVTDLSLLPFCHLGHTAAEFHRVQIAEVFTIPQCPRNK